MKKYFHEKNPLVESELNITFEQVLRLSPDEVREWLSKLRDESRRIWDEYGCPPALTGKDEKEIIKSFKDIHGFKFLLDSKRSEPLLQDENDGTFSIIRNFNKGGAEVNQFFPTMLKTRISRNTTGKGAISIYDYLSQDKLKEPFIKLFYRKIRKDGMHIFCTSIREGDKEAFGATTGYEWIKKYNQERSFPVKYGVLIYEKVVKEKEGGFFEVSADELIELEKSGDLPELATVNIDKPYTDKTKDGLHRQFMVKYYTRDEKVVEKSYMVFKLASGLQPAVNFPPTTAKFIYWYFTKHIKDDNVTVYDPSAGWGGRILGAMATDHKQLHYVGTDPNSDNFIPELGITRYEYLADFFNKNVHKVFWGEPNTYEIFRDGSEVIWNNPEFQKYKGNIDFVFTSPPYFNREQYNDEDTQSWIKFTTFEDWVEGFLRPTLETAVEYLKSDRYLALNIADIRISEGKYLRLEGATRKIMEDLGMEYKGVIKMLLVSTYGLPIEKIENKCKINGQWLKYEPVFYWYKH
jgi:hypothetical protein